MTVFLVIAWLTVYDLRKVRYVLLVGSLAILCGVYHVIYQNSIEYLVMDMHFQLRLILSYIIYLYMWSYAAFAVNSGGAKRLLNDLKILFVFSYVFVMLNIFASFLGYGYTAHHSSFGSVDGGYGGIGYFRGANQISAVLIIIVSVIHYYVWVGSRGYIKYMIISCISLGGAIGVQSKVSILGVFVIVIIVPVLVSGMISGVKLKLRPFLLMIISLIIFIFVISWLVASDAGIVTRFLWFYERSGLTFAIYTGRTYFFDMAMDLLVQEYNVLDYILGTGWLYYITEMGGLYKANKLVEIDYIDIFMINGFVGVVMIVLIWGKYISMSIGYLGKTKSALVVLFVNFFLLLIASTSGHVLYSAVNSLFVASIQVIPMLEYAVGKNTKIR